MNKCVKPHAGYKTKMLHWMIVGLSAVWMGNGWTAPNPGATASFAGVVGSLTRCKDTGTNCSKVPAYRVVT